MRHVEIWVLMAITFSACGGSTATAPEVTPTAPKAAEDRQETRESQPDKPPLPAPEEPAEMPAPAPVVEPPEIPKWPPAGVARKKTWPFYQWDRAAAFTFNLQQAGPGMNWHVWSPSRGVHADLSNEVLLTDRQAQSALKLLVVTDGGIEVSKCPFPRHGIVFYAGDVAVGSISVCFECGDILTAPSYNQKKATTRRLKKRFQAYERVFPKWKSLFQTELGLPTDWKQVPGGKMMRSR